MRWLVSTSIGDNDGFDVFAKKLHAKRPVGFCVLEVVENFAGCFSRFSYFLSDLFAVFLILTFKQMLYT